MTDSSFDAGQLPSYAELLRRTDAPPGSAWGLFGVSDQLGTLNLLRCRPLTECAREIRSGTAFSLDLPSDAISVPLAATRRPLEHHLFQRSEFHRDEWLDSFYPQYGSQIDGLRHFGHPDYGFYNGTDPALLAGDGGPLSIHRLAAAPIAGRAVLLDVDRRLRALGRPVDHNGGQAITADDLDDTLAAQGTTLEPGDILLLRFGWLNWYLGLASRQDQERVARALIHPGLEQSHEVLAWLWDHRIAMVAADNFAVECWPARPDSPFRTTAEREGRREDPHAGVMHRALIALLGMPLGELWYLDELAAACHADGHYSCMLTAAPFPLVGGVGAPAGATAIR